MLGWADAVAKGFDFLRTPSGFSVAIMVILFMMLLYAAPLAVVTWTSWDNTNRLEDAIVSLRNCPDVNVSERLNKRQGTN